MVDEETPRLDDESSEAPIPSSRRRRTFPFRLVDRSLWLLIIVFLISQVAIWNLWESGWGDSLKNLITISSAMLLAICMFGWWFLFGPVRMRSRLLVGIPLLLLLCGWVGSIRAVEPTGDMLPHIIYKWEPLPEKQLRDHLASIERPSTDVLEDRPVPEIEPEDMPAYRGVNRDGVVIGPPLDQDWQTTPPPELFRQPCGGGYSAFAVVDPFAITIEQRDDDEAIVCYDSLSGKEQWVHRYPASFFEAMGGEGPRATPTIHGDAVYSFGAFGDLFCLDLLTGQPRWHVNVLQQFDLPNTSWAMTSSPLIHDGKLVVNVGGTEGNCLAAYSPQSGNMTWKSKNLPNPKEVETFKTGQEAITNEGVSVPGYSSPMVATVAGVEQILNFDGKGLHGNDPETGAELWFYPFENHAFVSVAQPIVLDDDQGNSSRIYITTSYDLGAAMIRVTHENSDWSTDKLYDNKNMKCKFTSPVYHNGYIYGLDEGIMVCIDPETGDRMWKGSRSGLRGRYRHGQILLTNGQIVALTEQGELVLVEPSPDELKEVTWMRVLPKGKNWNPLSLARGRVYVRNTNEMAAFDLTAR